MIELREVTKDYGKIVGIDKFSIAVNKPGIY
jgi:hypothetical protein